MKKKLRTAAAVSVKNQPTSDVQPQPAAARLLPAGVLKHFGLLAAAFAVLLYVNTLANDYCYDDSSAIARNSVVQGGLKNIGTIFSTEYRYGYDMRHVAGELYRPLTLSLLALEWQLVPNSPFFYHLISVLLYGATGWLLWSTCRRMFAPYPDLLPAMAVLLFLAHPVHTEVVANIKSQDELLALLFSTAALYGLWRYFEGGRPAWLAGGVAAYGMALFSKEGAITFLAVFPLTIWFFTGRRLSENLKISALFLLPAALFLIVRASVLGAQGGDYRPGILLNFIPYAPDFAGRLASAFMVCCRYLWVLVAPCRLVYDLSYPQLEPVTFADWQALAGLVLYACAGVWALLQIRKKSFPAYAVLFFLLTFSVYSNVLYIIGTSYGERLLYMPSLGFSFFAAWWLQRLFSSAQKRKLPVLAALAVVLLLYGARTVTRNADWKDDFVLTSADIATAPNSARLNFNMGKHLKVRGYDQRRGAITDRASLEKAVQYFTASLKLWPNNSEARGERGWVHAKLGSPDLAYADYLKAIEINPKNAQALFWLGYLCSAYRHEPEKAEAFYRRSIQADPRQLEPHRSLGTVLAQQQRFQEAIGVWEKGLALAPADIASMRFISRAYMDMGRPDESRKWLEQADGIEKKLKSEAR